MQLKLHFATPISDIGIINTLHEYGPGMRVVVWHAGRFGVFVAELVGGGAVDEGPEDGYTFHAFLRIWRRHFKEPAIEEDEADGCRR
jgi:hypothetical protein